MLRCTKALDKIGMCRMNKMSKQIRNVTFPIMTETLEQLKEATGKDTIKDTFDAVIEDYLSEKVR